MNALRPFAVIAVLGGSLLCADPGHEVLIEDLNRQITENPALPDLYFQRAANYREINRLADARADLEKCLTLQAGFLPASRELARLDEMENHRKEGIERLQKAIAAAPESAAFHLPGCYSALADMFLKSDRNGEALAAAIGTLRKKYGKKPAKWAWGRVRPMTLKHFAGDVPGMSYDVYEGGFSKMPDFDAALGCYFIVLYIAF